VSKGPKILIHNYLNLCMQVASNLDNRQQRFLEICNLITENVELQHAYRTHTWGPVSIQADPVSETVGAIVAGLSGYGQVGQAPENRNDDDDIPGDYTDGSECKRQFRIYPNLDFRLHGEAHSLGTRSGSLQLIRLDEGRIDENTLEQLSPSKFGIHHQIQSNSSSLQIIVERDGAYYAEDNMGISSGSGCFVLVTKEGIRYWNKGLGGNLPGQKEKTGDYDPVVKWKDIISESWLKSCCRDNLSDQNRKGFSSENYGALMDRLERNGINVLPPPGVYITMKRGCELEIDGSGSFWFMFRQERGHFNLSKVNRETLRRMLNNRIILVSHHFDRLGRVCCSVLSFENLDEEQIDTIIDEQFSGRRSDAELQPNWYLFNDNTRHKLYRGANSLRDRGARLLAHAVQQPSGFVTTYWNPDNPELISSEEVEEKLVGLDENLAEMPAEPEGFDLEDYYANETGRREQALRLFTEGFVNFYRAMRVHTDANQMGGNIGFDHLIEHMVMLWFGLRGTRSGARGVDVYEPDGEPSEVKSATGQQGDFMGSADNTKPFKAGSNVTKIQSWRRLFFNRLVDVRESLEEGGERGNLHLVMWAPTQRSMEQLHQNTVSFFSDDSVRNRQGRASASTKENIQWTINDLTDNRAISSSRAKRWIDLFRAVEFKEFGQDDEGPIAIPPINQAKTVPVVGKCTCNYCKKGTFYWDKTGGVRKFEIRKKKSNQFIIALIIFLILYVIYRFPN